MSHNRVLEQHETDGRAVDARPSPSAEVSTTLVYPGPDAPVSVTSIRKDEEDEAQASAASIAGDSERTGEGHAAPSSDLHSGSGISSTTHATSRHGETISPKAYDEPTPSERSHTTTNEAFPLLEAVNSKETLSEKPDANGRPTSTARARRPTGTREAGTVLSNVRPLAACDVKFPAVEIFEGTAFARSFGGVAPAGAGHADTLPAPVPLRPASTSVAHRLVHPQGFRILKDTSVLERTLRGYFRLPSAPNQRLLEERRRVQQTLLRVEKQERAEEARITGGAGGVVLDGFLLLSASGAEDPDAVEAVTLQASHLIDTVPEDLVYFTKLLFLDVSENTLPLESLLALPALETLHMACNKMQSLTGLMNAVQQRLSHSSPAPVSQSNAVGTGEGGPLTGLTGSSWGVRSLLADMAGCSETEEDETADGEHSGSPTTDQARAAAADSFGGLGTGSHLSSTMHDVLLPSLLALNLSYNAIPSSHLHLLAYFPCLEKLDLSGNNLCSLPADLSCLSSVTHLALESNNFSSRLTTHGTSTRRGRPRANDSVDVFVSLSTMPSLVEANLNHNKLSRVPLLSVQDGQGLCFPSIEVLGLSNNHFRDTEDVAPLAPLHRTLRRVVLSNNPICKDPHKITQTILCFQQCIVDAYWERTTKDMEAEERRQQRCGSVAQNHTATDPAPEHSSSGDAGDADTALWKGQSWDRLLPLRPAEEDPPVTHRLSGTTDVSAAARAAAHTYRNEEDTEVLLPCGTSTAASDAPDSAHTRDHGDDAAAAHTATTGSLRDFYATVEDYLEAHYVNLVFQDAAMPKRNTRFFYATQTRANGQSTLVTIPEYKEFMDVYRITGKTKEQVHHHRRPAAVAKRSPRPTVFPDMPRSTTPEREAEAYDEGAQSADDAHDGDSIMERSGVFMTALEGGAAAVQKAPHTTKRRDVPSSWHAAQAAARPSQGVVGSGSQAGIKASPRLPPLATDGVDINVHSAMNELKALLRRPLVPLPYAQPKSGASHKSKLRHTQ